MEISKNIFVTKDGILMERGKACKMIIDEVWEMNDEILVFGGNWFIID